MRVGVACLLLTACYAPVPQSGSPCVDDAHCPTSLVCSPATMTCETTRVPVVVDADVEVDAPDIDAPAPACNPCEPNDGPGGAIDVTAGGTFTANLMQAADHVGPNGCGGDGGRDVFYSVTLTAPTVYYFDTFTSSFDSVIRIYTKPCSQVGAGANAAQCDDDQCNGAQSQGAISLPTGESCIVIDQRDAAQSGSLTLHVLKANRNGIPLAGGVQVSTGDTCGSTNITDPIDQCDAPGSGGKDLAYFFTACPNQSLLLDADICPEPAWDPVLYVRRVGGNGQQIGCNDDNCGWGPRLTNMSVANSPLYFLYVDGFDPTFCGPYSLDTNIR